MASTEAPCDGRQTSIRVMGAMVVDSSREREFGVESITQVDLAGRKARGECEVGREQRVVLFSVVCVAG